ncbi:MAG: DUF4440 domain-containing protein [Aquisalinus sp.]|nr:DUF4440 domain-containing protein [Aquisalinus sp.]
MDDQDKPVEPDLLETLRQLEESLWQAETRFDDQYMAQILAKDFFEFGRSGKRYRREEMFFGSQGKTDIRAKLPLPHFSARYLSYEVVQTTYISEVVDGEKVQFANRTSIWTRQSGNWQLRFHQGTPTDMP